MKIYEVDHPRGADALGRVDGHAPHEGRAGSRLTREFQALRDQWRAETRFVSSWTARVLHPAYQRIIGMGKDVLPLLLAELNERPSHWSAALEAITRENPVPEEDRGNIPLVAEAWLAWGRNRGYVD